MKKMKLFIIVSLLLGAIGMNSVSAQKNAFVEHDLRVLKDFAKCEGKNSKVYNDKLLNIVSEYSDTCYLLYFKDFVSIIIENNMVLRNLYGINSPKYRDAMDALDYFYKMGKHKDSSYFMYKAPATKTLLALEKIIRKVSADNRAEFAGILSGIYKDKKEYAKALKYAELTLKERHKLLKQNVANYAYALGFYIQALSDCGKYSLANSKISSFINLEGLNKEEKCEVYKMAIWSLNPKSSDELWLTLMNGYSTHQGSLELIMGNLNDLALDNRYALIRKIDSLYFNNFAIVDKIKTYRLLGLTMGQDSHNWEAAVYYDLKSIYLADSTGNEDLEFYKLHNGTFSNDWETVSWHYSKLGETSLEIWAQEKAVDVIKRKLGEDSEEWINAAKHLGTLYSMSSDYERSINIREQIYEQMRMSKYGDDSTIVDMGIALMGDLRQSSQFESAISLGDSLLSKNMVSKAQKCSIYNQIAMSQSSLAYWDSAIYYYLLALENAESNSTRWSISCNLAGLYGDLGKSDLQQILLGGIVDDVMKNGTTLDKFTVMNSLGISAPSKQKAMRYYEEAEKWIDKTIAPCKIITLYHNKATVSTDRYTKLENINKAFSLYRSTNQNDSVLLGILFHDMGLMYYEVNDYENAHKMYVKAFDCFNKLPFNDEQRITLLENMAINGMYITNDRSSIIDLLNNIKDAEKLVYGVSHPNYQRTLVNLFTAYRDSNDIIMADSVLKEYKMSIGDTLLIQKKFQYHFMKGEVLFDQGMYAEALDNFFIAEKNCTDPSQISNVHVLMMEVYRLNHQWDEYQNIVEQYVEEKKTETTIDYLQQTRQERKKRSFLLNNIFDYIVKETNVNKKIYNVAFDFSIFSKGLLYRTEKEFNRIISKDKEKYEEYTDLKDIYNKAVSNGDSVKAHNLDEKIEWMERELASTINNVKKLQKSLLVGKKDVLKCLPQQAMAINFIKFFRDGCYYYAAFIISHRLETPIFTELCKEEELTHELVYDNNGDLEAKKLKRYFENIKGNGLYKFVWEPLADLMKDYSEVYFSGDGLLNVIPIEFLKNDKREIVADKYKIHRVFSLADIKTLESMGNNIVAIGVADHNSPIKNETTEFRGGYTDLPEVKIEIDSIRNIIKDVKDTRFKAMVDDDAREVNVKGLTGSSITTLHLASHAFYLSPERMKYAAENKNDYAHNAAIRFLKAGKDDCSAVLLRNGNMTWHSSEVPIGDDDILTSDEIENLNFPNLNLVVLSACQTGKGETNIDGVWGLQRAFRIAGTKSLICSTRQVNSEYAEEFMSTLYRNLAKGENVYNAFKETRRYLYEKYSSSYDKWTSFILIE